MQSSRARLPLILREEPFGGILFDPSDATYLELDPDGFQTLRAWLWEKEPLRTPSQIAFAEQVRQEVQSLREQRERQCKLVEGLPALPRYRYATVLSAPTLVDLMLTRRCNLGCPHCYASSDPQGEHLPYEALVEILGSLAEIGVCQLALGGGEPLLNPNIVDVLAKANSLGMVPNLTTTGEGLTPRVLEAIAQYCGATALSLEGVGSDFNQRRRSGFRFFEASLQRLRDYGIPTVFQVTLSAENFGLLPSIVDYCLSCAGLYGVIFLAYKPVGRGEGFHTSLAALSPEVLYPELRNAFLRLAKHTRVGYDCCLTPGITGIDVELGFGERDLLEGCSAARTSVGITTALEVVPCTFATHRPLGNLGSRSFLEIWHSKAASAFRDRLDSLGDQTELCRDCASRSNCLGGCPEWQLLQCTKAVGKGAPK